MAYDNDDDGFRFGNGANMENCVAYSNGDVGIGVSSASSLENCVAQFNAALRPAGRC